MDESNKHRTFTPQTAVCVLCKTKSQCGLLLTLPVWDIITYLYEKLMSVTLSSTIIFTKNVIFSEPNKATWSHSEVIKNQPLAVIV